eukprot:gene5729-7913_t
MRLCMYSSSQNFKYPLIIGASSAIGNYFSQYMLTNITLTRKETNLILNNNDVVDAVITMLADSNENYEIISKNVLKWNLENTNVESKYPFKLNSKWIHGIDTFRGFQTWLNSSGIMNKIEPMSVNSINLKNSTSIITGNTKIKIVQCDLAHPTSIINIMKSCDVIINCPSREVLSISYWGSESKFQGLNVKSVAYLLKLAKQSETIKKFIHIINDAGNVQNYYPDGLSTLSNINENSPLCTNPTFLAPLSQSMAMAERLVLTANDYPNFESIVIKYRLLWGKCTNTHLEVCRSISDGVFKWLSPDYLTSTCHIKNLCEGLLLACNKGKGGNSYFIVDLNPISFKKLVTDWAETQHISVKNVDTISSKLAWMFASGFENIPFIGLNSKTQAPISCQQLALLGQEITVNCSKAMNELGYHEVISYEEGINEIRKEKV